MLQGTGTTRTRVAPATALAYLADPRHAPEWFARVAVEDLEAAGAPRAGQTWRFVEGSEGSRRARRGKPVRMVVYEAGKRFVWESQLARGQTNTVWEVDSAPAAEGGTTLRLSVRWRPSGLGWPWVLVAALVRRGALRERAQHTVERAQEAVEAAYPAAPTPVAGGAERPRGTRGPSGRRRKRR
jgi:hypothetical protein